MRRIIKKIIKLTKKLPIFSAHCDKAFTFLSARARRGQLWRPQDMTPLCPEGAEEATLELWLVPGSGGSVSLSVLRAASLTELLFYFAELI